MKNFAEEKSKLLLSTGYGENAQLLAESYYQKLPDEEKKKYVKSNEDSYGSFTYSKEKEIPDYTEAEFDVILKMETYAKLECIEKQLKAIKYCSLFFVILTVLSIIAAYSLIG